MRPAKDSKHEATVDQKDKTPNQCNVPPTRGRVTACKTCSHLEAELAESRHEISVLTRALIIRGKQLGLDKNSDAQVCE